MAARVRNLALAALAFASLFGCEQPRPRCRVTAGDFVAHYTLVSADPCGGEPLRPEFLSVQAYTARRSERDPRPDVDKNSIAIQPSGLSDLIAHASGRGDPNGDDPIYAFGAFDSARPDDDDVCTVPMLTGARVRLPALSETVDECGATLPAESALDVSYTFRNVRVFVTAAAYGTRFEADLTYTKDGCSADYKVTAVPVIPCGAPAETPDAGMEEAAPPMMPTSMDASLLDAALIAPDGEPSDAEQPFDAEPADAGEPTEGDEPSEACAPPEEQAPEVPDDSVCKASASNLHGDVMLSCDPELLLCVHSSAAVGAMRP